MTTFHPGVDTDLPTSAITATDRRRALIDRLDAGEPFAILFGGQGADWFEPLSDLIRDFALESELAGIIDQAQRLLAPVADQLLRIDAEFSPLRWIDAVAISAEQDEPADIPTVAELAAPVLSVPGIVLTQLAGIKALHRQGVDVTINRPVAVCGHSQGKFAAASLNGHEPADVLAVAMLAGVAIQLTARRRGLSGRSMISVDGIGDADIADLDLGKAVSRVRNGRRTVVFSGPAEDLRHITTQLQRRADYERDLRERKVCGGQPFSPVIEDLTASAAFHHPDLVEAADIAGDWAAACGLNGEQSTELIRHALVEPIDWPAELTSALDAGAQWLLDIGPGDLATRISARQIRGRGAALVPTATREGHRQLTSPGSAPALPVPWSAFAPKLITLPDGSTRVETRFSTLTGRSPIVLAGMTPTTVDAHIVAAAANAGFWAELAGGGQVSEDIFAERMDQIAGLIEPGRTWAFNALFLDPYLWKMQIGQQRLLQRARAAGSAVDAVVISAGIPELDDAVTLIGELRAAGISHTVFKPGTVAQIKQILAIAGRMPETDLIVQVEGGRAGGHHSWEDLDDLLISTYADLRAHDNIVLAVGGGIGTPQRAADYLTGAWSRPHGLPQMPVDGILVGTAAMAALEATTSPQVKQLLVDTPGTPDWVSAGTASGGMASNRSQLGADIHEIDNTATRTGRLLDEVAGNGDAVLQRREEIITALNKTAKPYFGAVEAMTYAQWLDRYTDLCQANGRWIDVTLRDRFHQLLQRAEARLHEVDRGPVPTAFPDPTDVEDGVAALRMLLAHYPHAVDVVLHPADVPFFVDVCKQAGKPVPFVPVIDADVRRWWRSDSLWQAHDDQYDAEQVCIIPGPVAVAGIDRVDEPIAELLQRFEDATVDRLHADGMAGARVCGRRRANADATAALTLALAAPDAVWAGRTVVNPIHRLDPAQSASGWVVVERDRAEHPQTGAVLTAVDDVVTLRVPLGNNHADLTITVTVPAASALGCAPIVTLDDAQASMTQLLTSAAGGTLVPLLEGSEHSSGIARATVPFSGDLIADHAGVTAGDHAPRHLVPDALVGPGWPSVFTVLAHAQTEDGTPVVEGMLDLVHVDHQISIEADLPDNVAELVYTASVVDIRDTQMGRVVTVDSVVEHDGTRIAQLTERFVIRGRTAEPELEDPAYAAGSASDFRPTPRRNRVDRRIAAPRDMRAFARISGDHNPIHTSHAAARLAGLGEPIAHGMWLSAAAQQAVSAAEAGGRIRAWTTRFMSPVRPGADIDVRADRVGLIAGEEVIEVTCRSEGDVVMSASARMQAPRTVYAFPGQGIQHRGMGMAGYQRSKAAREIWDRADRHTRDALGFSILTVVRDNPIQLVADGTVHQHPDGVLFLTQFTQVAMAVLGSAQIAELREADAFVDGAVLAGHSVGEYNALSAVSGVIPLEAVVEVVFRRGSVMHTLVPRDELGRSNYRLAAIRPSQIGLSDADVTSFVDGLAESTGEFLQIVNYNLRGSQYAVAGTVTGLQQLETEINRRRAEYGGKSAFILVPGIDVPFHSSVLHDGVDDFRARLEELLPASIDPDILRGRYVPNLVPRPFSIDREFVQEIADLVPSRPLRTVLAHFADWLDSPGELCRTVLIELLAWQFASPVRWIETQDLFFASPDNNGLGVERFVEIGVGQSPTVANLAASTLKLPDYRGESADVVNIERDAAAVFATDEDPAPADDQSSDADPSAAAPVATAAAEPVAPTASAAPASPTAGEATADLAFGAAEATAVLIAWWTKMRPDQIGPADSIESLCEGASSRRNQLLVDLGGELGLGAIDGAADADMPTLANTVTSMARGYKPFGPVLSEALGDHLKKVLGPAGKRQAAIADRVNNVWQLGAGWAAHVTAEIAMATREGTSVRGGAFGDLQIASAGDVDAAIDASVQAVAARRHVTVSMPQAGGGEATVDAAALEAITGQITGPDGILANTARTLLADLGLSSEPAIDEPDADAAVLARLSDELGTDWMRQTAPVFDARTAVLIDDRWASAREDLARIATESDTPRDAPINGTADELGGTDSDAGFIGTGRVVADQATWWAAHARSNGREELAVRLDRISALALGTTPGTYAGEVAVVTGAGSGSIAASAAGQLLAGGATVIVTTSGLNDNKLAFYRELYRSYARGGAELWIAPANMGSFADVDAFAAWVCEEQTEVSGGVSSVVKPAMTPTLLLPFAAGPVAGDVSAAGTQTELQMRILLWSVQRLMTGLSNQVTGTDIAARLHVVLPGSPNRGTFGGDGAYGEAKAALEAILAKWHSEPGWADQVTLAHAVIGWVRGTGLMGANDPLVEAAEAAGVRTWSTEEMAEQILDLCSPATRESARSAPVTGDLTGGLAEANIDLRTLAEQSNAGSRATDNEQSVAMIDALAPSPAAEPTTVAPEWPEMHAKPEDMVVIVGAGEIGPHGSSRTRFEMEVHDELSAAGVAELAWTTGMIAWDNGWYDVDSGESVDESQIHQRYHDRVVEACGIRSFADEGPLVDGTRPLLTSVYIDKELTFTVSNEAEARAMRDADPQNTVIAPASDGDWQVTRKAGTQIRVPRRMELTRTVGGQIPTGFDPTVWGVPADMVESLDRVAVWNLICTVDAFLSSGFTPAELMRWVHPAKVASTQGTGMGGMTSMQSLYVDTLLGESTPNDLLQEALPNVLAAHVMQSYIGGYGAMIHPVAACATTAVSVEEGSDKIRLGKADFVVSGGFDDLGVEGVVGFADMSATADTEAMRAKGIDDRYISRANDRRRGGFVESQGGGTILLARGDVAVRMGLPVLGVVAYAGSYADGIHTSIPAPGIGALSAGQGGQQSPLATSLATLGLSADDISVVSKHDTSTSANDPNESELHERLATAIGRSRGNPLYVISQKTLTGHAKGGAAAFQLVGLCQTLAHGIVPPNRSLDCVDDELAGNEYLVWLRRPLAAGAVKAAVLTSLGFGHVSGLIAVAHPGAFLSALSPHERSGYTVRAAERARSGRMRLAQAMCGGDGLYERPADRRFAASDKDGGVRATESSLLLDPQSRLGENGSYGPVA